MNTIRRKLFGYKVAGLLAYMETQDLPTGVPYTLVFWRSKGGHIVKETVPGRPTVEELQGDNK